MPTFVYRDGKLVDKRDAYPLYESDGAPNVISDTMPDLRHMADGRYYSSKSKFRAATKAHGCIEVGSDSTILAPRKAVPLSREKRRDDIRRTVYNLRNGIKA